MKTINNELIRTFNPCYDPSEKVSDEKETLPVVDWVAKYRGIVPEKDIIWLLCHKEFLSDKDLRLFAVWCAREALSKVENPDKRSIDACDVAERYANGQATVKELRAAAYSAAAAADAGAAYYAAAAAYYAAGDYAAGAAYSAATAAAYAAARSKQIDKLLTYFE